MEEEEEEEARHLTGLRTSQGGRPGMMGKFSWESCNASVHFVESTVKTHSAHAQTEAARSLATSGFSGKNSGVKTISESVSSSMMSAVSHVSGPVMFPCVSGIKQV